MMRLRDSIAAALLFIAGPACAQSLVAGEPLQYNHPYVCNNEHIIVAYCRDENDSSYCQTYYPDRPLHNGFMYQPSEMRGDIIGRLDACAKAASAQTASSTATPGGPPTHRATPTSTSGAPGLGKSTWRFLQADDELAEYFTTAAIKRGGASPSGWFTEVYLEPHDFGGGVKAIFDQRQVVANCTKRTSKLVQFAAYDSDQRLVLAGPVPNQPFEKAETGSLAADELDVLCGGSNGMAGSTSKVGDGEYLWDYTKILFQVREQDLAK